MIIDRRDLLRCFGGMGASLALAGCLDVQQQGSTNEGQGDNDGSIDDGSGPSGTATAWYSLSETELPAREGVIETFNDQSKHALEEADISDLQKKTTSAIPTGQGPQIFEWAHDWVGDYYQRGFVVDQSEEIGVSLDTFTEAAAQAVQFDGSVVGLPHTAETVTLIYNTEIVDEPPETVEEMVAVMEAHHDPKKNQYGLSYPFDPYFVSAWLQAFGGYYFDASKDDVLGIDNEKTVRGLQFALDNFQPYMPNDPTYEPQAAAFAEGNAAFAINGPWYLTTLNEKGVNYEVTTLPTPTDGTPNPYTGITMWYFTTAMENDDADTTAARTFVEWYVTNEDHILQLAEEQGSIPVLDSLVGSDELPEAVQSFSQTVEQGTPMPTHPKMNKVWPQMETALIEAFNGDASANDALNGAATSVRENWE